MKISKPQVGYVLGFAMLLGGINCNPSSDDTVKSYHSKLEDVLKAFDKTPERSYRDVRGQRDLIIISDEHGWHHQDYLKALKNFGINRVFLEGVPKSDLLSFWKNYFKGARKYLKTRDVSLENRERLETDLKIENKILKLVEGDSRDLNLPFEDGYFTPVTAKDFLDFSKAFKIHGTEDVDVLRDFMNLISLGTYLRGYVVYRSAQDSNLQINVNLDTRAQELKEGIQRYSSLLPQLKLQKDLDSMNSDNVSDYLECVWSEFNKTAVDRRNHVTLQVIDSKLLPNELGVLIDGSMHVSPSDEDLIKRKIKTNIVDLISERGINSIVLDAKDLIKQTK